MFEDGEIGFGKGAKVGIVYKTLGFLDLALEFDDPAGKLDPGLKRSKALADFSKVRNFVGISGVAGEGVVFVDKSLIVGWHIAYSIQLMEGKNLVGGADVGEGAGTRLARLATLFLFASSSFLLGLELLDPTKSVDKLHLAGKEGVAFAADVNRDIAFGGTGLETRTASTGHGNLMVLRMDV